MKLILTGIVLCCLAAAAQAQHTFKAIIKDGEGAPLAGATLTWKEQNKSFLADSLGSITITGVPNGPQNFAVSHAGLQEKILTYTFPLSNNAAVEIVLEVGAEDEQEEEVVVTATRISRTIPNAPTRVEVISGEELQEKANMKPGDIRMMLSESTGIQTQQTSATSYNSSIRIQGLDGRYTQLLKDGLPLYAGFSGGLSIMQITPLDLKQVDVIKGSASTLYGGGAIAGLINLISRQPEEEPQLSVLANGTSAGGL